MPVGNKGRFYLGKSMAITFHEGDYLYISEVIWSNIGPGDIIVFRGQEQQEIVHRVIVKKASEIITQGDNNDHPDTYLITNNDLIGVVTKYERKGKLHYVKGGKLELNRIKLLRVFNKVFRVLKNFLRFPYRIGGKVRWLEYFAHLKLTKIYLETENGPLVKYIFNQRTIARWWPGRHYFECQKPYDLVIPNPEKSKPT
jgi:hypothetical protein